MPRAGVLACSKEYKKEILYPILVSVARRYGQGELYEGMVSDSEQLVIPKGATEMEIRVRQVRDVTSWSVCHKCGKKDGLLFSM